MSITDLKRQSESNTPTISRFVGSISELRVEEGTASQPNADTHAARSPGVPDSVHPDPGAKAHGSVCQPGFDAAREMTLITHDCWRRCQIRIDSAQNLGAPSRTTSDGGTRPYL